ncbi:MAG: cupredoxin domain-containing protein [Dehalococcoidia bacterium]|nr:cupredoxin domain-containing protein [Dehalococcoidia bacterium]
MYHKRLRLGIVIAALAAVSLVAGACAGDDDGGDEPSAPVTKTAAATGTTGGGATTPASSGNGNATAEKITVSMTENKFTPDKLTVKAGVPITFVAKNDGEAVHNMKLLTAKTEGKDYSSELMVSPGKESSFTVTFSKTGTVKFQCDYHLPDMVGTIEVK